MKTEHSNKEVDELKRTVKGGSGRFIRTKKTREVFIVRW